VTDEEPHWKQRVRWTALATAVLAVLGAPWWGPPLLATLLTLDTLASVWMPLDSLSERVAAHPMVASAVARRSLPGTIRITVRERIPVALVPAAEALVAVDVWGEPLPIDPLRAPLDVPVLAQIDTTLLRVLDQVRQGAPTLWGRVSHARREGGGDLRLDLGSVTLRARDDVTVARLGDILPVEADLARRRLRPQELDLRFRDQVIARLP